MRGDLRWLLLPLMGVGTVDACSSDTFTTDGGSDGAVDVAADGGGPYCANKQSAIFCADFDESDAAAYGWSLGPGEAHGGVVSTTTALFASGPNAFQGTVPALVAGNAASALIATVLPSVPPAAFRAELDVAVSGNGTTPIDVFSVAGLQAADAGAVFAPSIELLPSGSSFTIRLVNFGVLVTLVDGAVPVTMCTLGTSIPGTDFVHLTLEMTTSSVTLGRGGFGDAAVETCMIPATEKNVVEVVVVAGPTSVMGPSNPTVVTIDNVLLTHTPP